MSEWLWITLPPLGWLFWSLGGTTWKGWRRYVWPLVLGLLLSGFGVLWWKACCTSISICIAAHLGYGESKTWIYRSFVGATYGASLWWLAFVWWTPLATAGWFIAHYQLSRRWDRWTWKLVEGNQGLLHGILAVWVSSS